MRAFILASILLAASCGGTTTEERDGSTDAPSSDAKSGDLNGKYPCAQAMCESGEYCVHPCCGGAAPICSPLPDAGNCPMGTHPANCSNGPGCQADPCKPPPPYCSSKPPVGCDYKMGRDVSCVCS
jgi:hypothetical protein